MFKSMKKRLENRKKEREYAELLRGYDYAAGVLLRKDKTPLELDSETTRQFSKSPHNFDDGIDLAIKDAINHGIAEDDRI